MISQETSKGLLFIGPPCTIDIGIISLQSVGFVEMSRHMKIARTSNGPEKS